MDKFTELEKQYEKSAQSKNREQANELLLDLIVKAEKPRHFIYLLKQVKEGSVQVELLKYKLQYVFLLLSVGQWKKIYNEAKSSKKVSANMRRYVQERYLSRIAVMNM